MAQGTSLEVEWLRRSAPNARGPGSIPHQGARFHTPQFKDLMCHNKRSCLPQLRPGEAK